MGSLIAIFVALSSFAHFAACAQPDNALDGGASTTGVTSEATHVVLLQVRDQAGRAVPRAHVFVDREPYGSIRAVPPTVVPPASTPTGLTDEAGLLVIARESTPFAVATLVASGYSPRMLRLWGSEFVESPEESGAQEVGDAPTVIDVVLTPCARIAGRVSGAPDGAAIRALTSGASLLDEARARLDGWVPDADAAFLAPIAADGTFAFDALPAAAVLRLDLVVNDAAIACLPECVALDPGQARRVAWTIGAGVALPCVVRDERGTPIEGAQVQLLAPSYGGWVSARDSWSAARIRRTDATGRVVFDDVLPGRWRIVLERPRSIAQRRAGTSWPEAEVTVDVLASGMPAVELTAFDVRTISGVVVDFDGAPVAGVAHVTRMVDGIPDAVSSMCDCSADGAFRSGPLAPGTYRIVADPKGPQPSAFAQSQPVYVQAGDDTLRVALRRGRSLDLRAIDEFSREPVDAHFSIGCRGGDWGPLCPYQLTPTRHVRGVPCEELLVIARTADGRVGAARVERPVAESAADLERLPVDVPVSAGGVLHVRYRGSVPVAHCKVEFDGVLVDERAVVSGGEARLAFPPGRGVLHWRFDPQGRGEARTALQGKSELTFVAGEETSIAIER